MITLERKRKFDWLLFSFIMVLIIIGSISILSSVSMLSYSDRIIRTHFIAIVIGIISMIFTWILDYDLLDEYSLRLYLFSLLLLFLVLIFGVVDKGAKSWFRLPFFSVQPSEFARIALIVIVASYISKTTKMMEDFSSIFKLSLITLPFFVLMIKQPDFSGILVSIFPLLVMFIVAGMNLLYVYIFILYIVFMLIVPFVSVLIKINPHFLDNSVIEFIYDISQFNNTAVIFIISVAVVFYIIYKISNKFNPLIHINYFILIYLIVIGGYLSGIFIKNQIKDYQYKRIESFIYPEKDPRGSGYNIVQARISLGSGGVFGKGVFKGSQSRLGFVPERHTDFIISVVGEEMGLFGVGLIMVGYIVLIRRIKFIAQQARNRFGYFLCCGFAGLFMGYFFINLGMILGFFPVAGVGLPFVSYGGSNILSSFIIIGILQSIYARRMVIG